MFKEMIDETVKNSFNVRDDLKNNSIEENKKIHDTDRLPFRICCLNIEGDLNVGLILRSASLLGCEKAYVFGRKKMDARSMVGVGNYMDIEKIAGLTPENELDIDAFDEFIRRENLFPLLIEQGGLSLRKIDWQQLWYRIGSNRRLCFVFGNEGTGIPDEIIQRCKGNIISIPQLGVLRSMNVGSAMSIVVWDFVNDMSDFSSKYGWNWL